MLMKKHKYLFLIGLTALCSCVHPDVDTDFFDDSGKGIITFRASISNNHTGKETTRAVKQNFNVGDHLLMFMEKSGNPAQPFSKAIFEYNEDGTLTTNPPVVFPIDSKIDIYSFYPADFWEGESLLEGGNVSPAYTSVSTDQTSESATVMPDVLYAASKQQSVQADPINLVYNHIWAKISIRLNPATTADVFAINIVGTKTAVQYHFSHDEGLVAEATGEPQSIAVDVTKDGYAEALVCPQTVAKGSKLIEFRSSKGSVYFTVKDKDLVLQAGREYRFDVTVSDQVEVNPSDIQATIYTDQTYGRLTRNLFYDIKGGASVTDATAKLFYGEEKMNGIRIPIYGNYDDQGNIIGHPAQGEVIESDYSNVIASIEKAREFNPDILVFASKKLNGKNSFPKWVRNQSGNTYTGVNDARYAEMLMDFLRFMKNKGIEVDVLGIDNEPDFNEGGITAGKFKNIVSILKNQITKEGLKMPKFIGPERYNPQSYAAGNFLYDLFNKYGSINSLDIYGTHYYPRHHYYSMNKKLKEEFSAIEANGKEFWATEPHWDNDDLAKADPLGHARMAICTLWDQTDLGLDAFMWWGYPTGYKDLRANLMHDISTTIYGSQPIRMDDHDGVELLGNMDYTGKWTEGRQKPNNDPIFDERLHTRAFIRNGNEVNVYFINVRYKEDLTKGTSYDDYLVKIDGSVIDGDITYKQWTDTTPVFGIIGKTERVNENMFTIDLPLRSITKITFKIKN